MGSEAPMGGQGLSLTNWAIIGGVFFVILFFSICACVIGANRNKGPGGWYNPPPLDTMDSNPIRNDVF